jgi:hypothetical protein
MLLITTPNDYSKSEDLSSAATALGWEVYSPDEECWMVPDNLKYHQPVIYGEPLFCRVISKQLGYSLIQHPPTWIVDLPKEYTSRNIEVMKFDEARKIKEPKFFKTIENDLCLPKVYDNGSLLPKLEYLNDVDVIVSDPMNFKAKFRCFVKDRRVITTCCYAINDDNPYKQYYDYFIPDVIHFVNKMLADDRVKCANSIVIDVGRYKSGHTYGTAVIKSQPVWSSYTYDCERAAILDALVASCVRN